MQPPGQSAELPSWRLPPRGQENQRVLPARPPGVPPMAHNMVLASMQGHFREGPPSGGRFSDGTPLPSWYPGIGDGICQESQGSGSQPSIVPGSVSWMHPGTDYWIYTRPTAMRPEEVVTSQSSRNIEEQAPPAGARVVTTGMLAQQARVVNADIRAAQQTPTVRCMSSSSTSTSYACHAPDDEDERWATSNYPDASDHPGASSEEPNDVTDGTGDEDVLAKAGHNRAK